MVSPAGPHASSCAGSRSALTARPSSPRRALVRQSSGKLGTTLMDGFAADKATAEGHRALAINERKRHTTAPRGVLNAPPTSGAAAPCLACANSACPPAF